MVAVAVVVVGVGVLLGSDVVQLDDVAALVAALNGALTGDLQGRVLVLISFVVAEEVLGSDVRSTS